MTDPSLKATDPPRGATVAAISSIVADVLGLERVGPDDDFFELGGNSMMAAEVAVRARRAFGLDLPMNAVYIWPTANQLALRIEATEGVGDAALGIPSAERRQLGDGEKASTL